MFKASSDLLYNALARNNVSSPHRTKANGFLRLSCDKEHAYT